MDLSRATVEVTGLSSVRLCVDSWVVDAEVQIRSDRPVLVDMHVRNDSEGITATLLSGLPIRGITLLAANAVWGVEETIYRTLATPLDDCRRRSAGVRSWPPDHYRRVRQVAAWAVRSGRPGGPAVCVGQFWGVSIRTARRWLAVASRDEQTP